MHFSYLSLFALSTVRVIGHDVGSLLPVMITHNITDFCHNIHVIIHVNCNILFLYLRKYLKTIHFCPAQTAEVGL